MRRASFAYDLTYPNEPLPVMRVEFRRQLSTPGLVLEKVIPDTGADVILALSGKDLGQLRLFSPFRLSQR
jgi:hypothetical protein